MPYRGGALAVADREGVVHVTQNKTRATLSSPVQPALAAISDATPTNHLTFLVTNYGSHSRRPASEIGFESSATPRALPARCAAHGLRKAACLFCMAGVEGIPSPFGIKGLCGQTASNARPVGKCQTLLHRAGYCGGNGPAAG